MRSSILHFLVTLLLITFSLSLLPYPVRAYTLESSSSATVTSTVPSTTPTTSDTTAPSVPILVRPTDGNSTGNNKVEFVWRQSSDPNGNVVFYTLYLNGVATYLGISNLGNSAGTGYTARLDGQEIKLIPTISLPDGVYNWYITAEDGSGNTSHSTTWNLTIDTLAPQILVSDIDIYHNLLLSSTNPENFSTQSFEILGPKDINFTIHTEPWSTITLQFKDAENKMVAESSWPVNNSGIIFPYEHLTPGTYHLSIIAYDHGANTTVLPDIILNISQAQISIPLPPIPGLPGLPPSYTIPYTPLSPPTLPTTIAQFNTRELIPSLLVILLALSILVLLILVWPKKTNLIILDESLMPITEATIYHSLPPKYSPVVSLLTKSAHGRLYLPRLTRFSTLTIRTSKQTYVLSLCVKRKLYTLVLN